MVLRRWRTGNQLFRIYLLIWIGGLSVLYFAYSEKVVPSWDPSSMVLLGQSLARNQSLQYFDVNNSEIGPYFNPHGFNIRAPSDAQPYSTFAPGLSIILAPVYRLTDSLDLLYLIPPVFSIIGLAAVAYVGYVLSGQWGSLFAVMLVGASHVNATFSTSLWADGTSLDLLLAGIALSMWAIRSKRKFVAVIAGACLGLFILFKFVNVVFVVLLAGGELVIGKNDTRRVSWWLLPGIAVGIAGMLAYQAGAYGSPLANAYQPWGQSLYNFPLFSLSYLFLKSPAPWNDISNTAILSGMLTDMHIWSGLFIIGLVIDRKNPLRLLLALIVVVNVGLYAVSVFSPRQFINMRYLLPALVAAYVIAADVLARLMRRASTRVLQGMLLMVISIICVGSLFVTTLPDLASRNANSAGAIRQVIATAQALPAHPVVLAYSLADSFILYGKLSVLNYRRVAAPDLNTRNQLVIQAIDKMICRGQSVYLIQDDETLFDTIYPALAQKYILRLNHTPIPSYEIQSDSLQSRCTILNQSGS